MNELSALELEAVGGGLVNMDPILKGQPPATLIPSGTTKFVGDSNGIGSIAGATVYNTDPTPPGADPTLF